MSETPRVGHWHLWTDASDVSHHTRCELSESELKGVGKAAPHRPGHFS